MLSASTPSMRTSASGPSSRTAGGLFHHPPFRAAVLRPLPLLLVHGTHDKPGSYDEAFKLYEAAQEPKEFVAIEGAGHGYVKDNGAAARDARH